MNESQTRHDKIDPKLASSGWGKVNDSYVLTEVHLTKGRISTSTKQKPLIADYVLRYKGVKLAVVEAKSDEKPVSEGVAQAKLYAEKLKIRYTYATNGDKIYAIDMETGEEGEVAAFPTPEALWTNTFATVDAWRDTFNTQPFYSDGSRQPRYYQEIAVSRALEAISKGQKRILLTLATGTGKTFIASQIAYKLFQTKWNIKGTDNRPRVLFLADRNILANQAFNDFSNGFKIDALKRIKPSEISKEGRVSTNGSIFFTIFQTFLSGDGEEGYFGQYPNDFFDLIIIDECHRGGAKDESSWRKILDYFEPAVQLGLTATPKRDANVDTYQYFGKPVYEYSLKEGIDDGFLTPFRHSKMQSNIDDYIYTSDDEVVSGEIEEGKTYTETDFYQGKIEIKERDWARVREFMKYIKPDEKTIVFCYTQNHAGQIRDMINQVHHGNPNYCVRVTSNDGAIGEQYLADFQDNERTIPTVLTTSQKLSTGVDARNVRNIVLLRPVNSMIEFKQIVGRGTRIYEGKHFFTIYDFVHAYEHFADPAWDGEPVCSKCGNDPCTCKKKSRPYEIVEDEREDSAGEETPHDEEVCPICGKNPCECEMPEKLEVRLSDGHTRKIKHIKTDMFWGADGKPVTVEEFLNAMFGKLPEFFTSVEELKAKWGDPDTRNTLLEQMDDAGYGMDVLKQVRTVIDADNSDLLDVLEYIAYAIEPMERAERAKQTEAFKGSLAGQHQAFIAFLSNLYVEVGVEELAKDKLPEILKMKYGSVIDGIRALGDIDRVRSVYYGFQRALYQ